MNDDETMIDMDRSITQCRFASLIGVSEAAVSNLVSRGILLPNQTAHEWLNRYLTNLREQIILRLQGRI